MIRGLGFEGNRAIDDYTLGISIAASNSSWWARTPLVSWIGLGEKRYFDEREFRRDVLRLQLLYSRSGFLDAQIDTVVRRNDGRVAIRFLIDEGEPVRVTSLTIGGTEDVIGETELRRNLPLQIGDPFNRFLLNASTDTILSALRNRGYPFVEVFRGFEVNRDTRMASVSFDVEPGPRATVEAVLVEGAGAIGDRTVRRIIPVRAGRLYRERDLYDAQRDLYRTGIYDYADVRLLDSLPEEADDSAVTVQVRVREGPLNRVRFGAGYGTLDCFRFLGGWTGHHVLGGARSLDLSARLSKVGTGDPLAWGFENSVCRGLRSEKDSTRLKLNFNVTAAVTEPVLFWRGTSGTLSLFGERRSELNAYVREAVGGEVSVTRRTRWDVPITLSYGLQRGSTRAEPASFCVYLNICRDEDIAVFERPFLQATLGLLVVRNRQNSFLNPTRGSLTSAELQWAAPLIGSDTLARFARFQAQYAMYLPLGRRSTLGWRVQYGALLPETFALKGQSLRDVPPAERFYGGGPNSVRGYGQNELGPVVHVIETTATDDDGDGVPDTFVPVDTITSASGGNSLLFANVEVRFPLPGFAGRLQGALFVDAGQVAVLSADTLSYRAFRVTPGVGVRLATGIGPIRLDLAYNGYGRTPGTLYERRGDELQFVQNAWPPPGPTSVFDRIRLHFSVGQAF